MSTPQDRIIEALEAEIIRLKAELAVVIGQRDEIKNNFDELKVILRET